MGENRTDNQSGSRNPLGGVPVGETTGQHLNEEFPAAERDERAAIEDMIAGSSDIVLSFSARWCTVGELLLARAADDGVSTLRIDVDNHPGLADRYDVHSLPCHIRLRNGREEARLSGACSVAELAELSGRNQHT